MKPSFALQFTESGITLLHRSGRGWLPLGDAALDDPALADNLGYLRATALGLEPQGITTKLVIPNGQILYTTVDAPAPEPGKRRNQIRRALEGRTPYGVDDLAFDWSGSGPQVMVAVVPRETLAEAEAFALDHRFNPMGFVAMPEPGTFDGEPFFGPSAHAAASLAPGEKVERDRAAMRIIGRGDGARAAGAKAVPVVPEVIAPEFAEPVVAALAETLPVAGVQPVAEPVVESALAHEVAPDPVPGAPVPVAPVPVAPVPVAPVPVEPVPIEPSSAEIQPAYPSPVAAAATLAVMDPMVAGLIARVEADLGFVAPAGDRAPDLAPDLAPHLAPEPAPPPPQPVAQSDDGPEAPAMFDVPMDDSDLPDMPHAVPAFASRRNGAVTAAAVAGGEARQPLLGPALKPAPMIAAARVGPEVDSPAPLPPPRATGKAGPAKIADPRAKLTATTRNGAQPGALARYVPMKGKGRAVSAEAAPLAEKTAGPDFGKRALARRPPVRGKPRYLGLTLTLLLVLVLAAVAIWSTYFLGNGTVDPAADISSPAATDSADAAAGTAPADSALPPADAAQSDVLVEPPEADPGVADPAVVDAGVADAGVADTATADAAAGADATTDPAPETAVAATASSASAPPPDGAVLPDATLSTSDQTGQAGTGAVAATDPGSAAPDGAVVPPAPVAAAVVAPTPDPAASAAATPEVQPDPAPGATIAAGTETGSEAGTQTAAAPVPKPEPKPEPPAAAPQAETSATAALSGQVLDQGDVLPELMASDKGLQTTGPAELAEPLALAGDAAPDTPLPPAPFGTFFDRDPKGWVIATPQGAVTPEGALVIAGRPDLIPPRRPVPAGAVPVAAATADPPAPETGVAAVQSDPALAGARPKPRPRAPGGSLDGTSLRIEPQIATASTARPRPRPATTLSEALPDTGQGFATATDQAIAVSSRPAARPADIAASVAAALAKVEPQAPAVEPVRVVAAVAPLPRPVVPVPDPQPQAAAPEADNEPEVATAMPAIPQNASVARQATLANAINLGKINLIGVYGTPSNRHALVRLASGRYVRVKVGDRVDGGQVAAISEQELRYIKNGRNLVLALPKDS